MEKLKRFADRCALALFAILAASVVAVHHVIDLKPISEAGALVLSPLRFLGLLSGVWLHLLDISFVLLMLSLLPNAFFEWPTIRALLRREPHAGSVARALLGVLAVFGLVGFFAPISQSDEIPRTVVDRKAEEELTRKEADAAIEGLPLSEFARRMSVPVSVLREKLSLPSTVRDDQPLAQIAAITGKKMQDFRSVVFDHHRDAGFKR